MPQDTPNPQPTDRTLIEVEHDFQLAAVHLWPVVPDRKAKRFSGYLNQHGIKRLATDHVPDKDYLTQSSSQSILLLTPIASPLKALQIADDSKAIDIIATVDHYAQIEILQHAAAEKQTNLKVLVAINSGANFFGCRPGTEARQLVLACRQQRNLTFTGLSSEIPPDRTVNDISLEDPAIGALLGTAFKLQRSEIACELMHLRTHTHVSPSRIPTGWHVSPPLQTISGTEADSIANQPSDLKPLGKQHEATVIARPSLQHAVIDCGTQTLLHASEIVFTNSERIPIKQMDATRCVLDMAHTTTELSIGQQIQFSLSKSNALSN